jgi:carbamoyltransferase
MGKPTAILGISALYHDSAAALLVNGQIVAAAQEERFTRRRHDASFPEHAIRYCLTEAALNPEDLAYIAFYDKPLLKFDRILETFLAFAPLGFRAFSKGVPLWIKQKLLLRRELRRRLGKAAKLVFPEHHESHAASAFFPSPYEKAAILTIDGVGEWATAAYGIGVGNRIRLLRQLEFPHSLGLLYSAFTYYCGFRVNSGEFKLMSLAPYGKPVYVDAIYKYLVDLRPDGSLWLDMRYFDYGHGLTMTGELFHRLFGGPPRTPESAIEQRHMDLAASIQAVTEQSVLRMARHVHRETSARNLVLAGGVALNCVANGRLLREGPYESIWVQPAAGDAGGALGAGQFVWYQLLDNDRNLQQEDAQRGSLLGPRYSTEQVRRWLDDKGVPFTSHVSREQTNRFVAEQLAAGKIIAWFHGRMEFGPRALGARSILADPRSPEMQATLNLRVKFRESFRPFAPAVLGEHASDWFEMNPRFESPYMLLTASVKECRRATVSAEDSFTMQNDPDLHRRIAVVRSQIPAVTHVDYSARIQTVDEVRNPDFYSLLHKFYELTGCPVLVNTSFNIRGEPIVCTPQDAYAAFLASGIDFLVLETMVISKADIDPAICSAERQKHLARHQVD